MQFDFPTLAFLGFAATAVMAALATITSRNPVLAALWLVRSFFSVPLATNVPSNPHANSHASPVISSGQSFVSAANAQNKEPPPDDECTVDSRDASRPHPSSSPGA